MPVRPIYHASTVFLATALLAGGLTIPAAGLDVPVGEGAASSPAAASVKCAPDAVTESQAREIAVECGTDTVVSGALTEWMTPTVDGDTGNLDVEYSAAAVRQDSDGDGQWADVAVQVHSVPEPDGPMAGLLPVAGGVEPIWLSPGGPEAADLPLAVIGTTDRRVSMFSASLPVDLATVSDVAADRVTYDFGQGVTLIVSVASDGTSIVPVVRVADPAALEFLTDELLTGASDDGAVALEFPLRMSAGLTLQDAQVGFEIHDADGTVAFESGPALMWDSAGEEIWDGVGTTETAPARLTSDTAHAANVQAEATDTNEPDEDRLVSPASGEPARV